MQKTLRGALAASTLAALALGVSTASASPRTFNGHVCSLVTTSAARAAGIQAPCVEQTQSTPLTAAATWGARDGGHYLSVRIGPLLPVMHPLGSRIQPRLPRWLGPIRIAPGVNAYYTLSRYHGTADRAGAMRFTNDGQVITITLINAHADALPGLTAIAKSVEPRL